MRRLLILCLLFALPALGQTVRNPKLSPQDLAAAQAETTASGGSGAELVYTTRIDAIEKGSFDTLVVIYAKPAREGKDYYATIVRGDKKYPLNADRSGRALLAGDRFLRIGLRHEAGNPPLLRLMGAMKDPAKPDEQQRNLDFQFNGAEFALVAQSVMPLPK